MPLPGVCRAVLNERRKSGDPGSPANPDTFLEQSFRELHRECLSRRARFVDDAFPPDTRSIGPGLLQPERLADVVWLRPRQIVPDPYFILNGMSRFDIIQGELGNCWFLAAIGALTFQKSTREQIIPTEQSFQVDYAGIFHFRFWRFGKWVDVVIDDLLPTIDGHLIFVQSKTPNEFWAALMEKAYAKVCGSYADMNAGNISEALMDFTGRAHITYQLQPPPPELWDLMYRAAESGSLMGCGTPPAGRGNAVQPNGIVEGHAYTVTGVAEIMSSGNPVKLVRLLNPWGHGEWRGDWSDKSPKWRTVSPEDRMSFLSIDDNGEFWMSVDDFCQNYATVDICGLWPGFFYGSSKCHWMSCDGRWVAGTTAGGCINHTESFWTNPQFRITLVGTGAQVADNSHSVFVSLMQKPDKRHRHLCSYHYIGFSIFMVPPEFKGTQGKFPAPFFSRKNLVAHTQNYLNSREVTEFFRLSQGEYIIVPSTFKPGESASFLLTVFSKFEICVEETSSGQMEVKKPQLNETDQDSRSKMFRQYHDQFEEVDAEQLQRLLNENIVQGALRGFSLDSCRSIVALMDLSVTGHLNADEFRRLWLRVVAYRDIFYRNDSSKDGLLSLSELRSAVMAAGIQVSDGFLSIMALRYGDPTGRLSLESFITLILRMECMSKIFRSLSDGRGVYLQHAEWMHLTMYS